LSVLWAAPASAQEAVSDHPAFSVERFTPAPGHAAFGVVEDPDVLPALQWAASLWTSVMARPIVLRNLITDEVATVPVRWRLGVEAGGAIGLGARYQVGAVLPWAGQGGDRLRRIGLDDAPLDPLVLGDLRLHGRARLAGAPGARGMAAALAATLTLPTGDDDEFAGEAGAVIEWKLAIGWRREVGALAANLGVRLRTEEVVLLSPARPHGNELVTGVAGELALPWLGRALTLRGTGAWLIGEATYVSGDQQGGVRGPSPGEVRAGLRLHIADGWMVTALGGGGVTPDDLGSPAWRFALGVTHDRAPTTDRDRDRVLDGRDRCRDEPEDRDGFDDADGCLDPDDDRDGVLDAVDQCPRDAEDLDDFRDADGCPDTETYPPPRPDPDLRAPPIGAW